MVTKELVPADVLTLAELLRAEWPAARERIRLSGDPTNEGDDDGTADDADKGDDDGKQDDAKADDPAGKKDDDADDDQGDPGDKDAEPDWKARSRQNERRAKTEKKRADELAAKLADIEKANLSDQEKAIATAREEAAAEVTSKYEATQRADRIENAVTKLSLKGFKGKDKDGNDITLRFADPDDAQLRIDRALRNEDLAYDDIYTDGKVQTDALTTFLTELLEEHPRLRAEDGNGSKKPEPVDFDGGKGKGGGSKTLEEMDPDDHLKAIQGKR